MIAFFSYCSFVSVFFSLFFIYPFWSDATQQKKQKLRENRNLPIRWLRHDRVSNEASISFFFTVFANVMLGKWTEKKKRRRKRITIKQFDRPHVQSSSSSAKLKCKVSKTTEFSCQLIAISCCWWNWARSICRWIRLFWISYLKLRRTDSNLKRKNLHGIANAYCSWAKKNYRVPHHVV